MAAIKHTLQREVFLPSAERLIAVVHVTKPGKKKKPNFLCAAVTTEKPIQANIYQVKKADRGDLYKKKTSWTLRELKQFDAKCSGNKDSAEFDIHFDKSYKWLASSLAEKNAFVQCLHRLSQRYLVHKPKFHNILPGLLDDDKHSSDVDRSVQQAEEMASASEWEYQALTPRECDDLETLMGQVENAIGDAEAFAEQLSKDLCVLDGANVLSIMGSEERVMELMMLLDNGLKLALEIEEKIDKYDESLQTVRDLMESMRDKDNSIQIRNTNHQKLLDELQLLVTNLDLEQSEIRALLDANLSTPQGIRTCREASKHLLECMLADIHPSMRNMEAVAKQMDKFNKVKVNFAKRLAHHLNNYFIHQGNELGETLSRFHGDLKLPCHGASHKDLLPYADMMHWLRQVDRASFDKLSRVYTASMCKLYGRELAEFMDAAKTKLQQSHAAATKKDASSWFIPSAVEKKRQAGSASSLHKDEASRRSGSVSTLDSDHGSRRGSELDLATRSHFDQMLEHVLSELAPACQAEQDFCVHFFHLTTTVDDEGEEVEAGSQEGKQRRMHEELRRMMSALFPTLEQELSELIQYGHKMDSFNCLYMLVRMSQHVIPSSDKNSFLIKVLGNLLVQIRKIFDNFIKHQIQNVRDCKPFKKSKIGILSFVHEFENFAPKAEAIFRGAERRNELDKAYGELVGAMIQEINRVGDESPKISPDVIKFENYHRMFDILRQLKIACLETQKKETKQLYQEHMQKYVTMSLGRPMEKLNIFFEGIESRVAAGVKEEEVGFQLAYSKAELKKVIREYPGKEVKKGLDHLYKKVEKHLCEEENLVQVLWHSLQDEFLKQYKHFDSLIAKCYPGSGITLEFTINDLLAYFSDIAQSH